MQTSNGTDWQAIWTANHERFKALALGHIRHTHLMRGERLEEALQDIMFDAWMNFSAEIEKGTASIERMETCFFFAVKHVLSGRTCRFGSKTRDVHSQEALGHCMLRQVGDGAYALIGTDAPVPDIVATRLDFVAFLDSLDEATRFKVRAFLEGDTTKEAAERFHVSPSAISQTRAKLAERYQEFLAV